MLRSLWAWGGVEPGRYRLWVRKVGDTGTGESVDVTLQNGMQQVASPNARVAYESSPETILWEVYPNPAEQEATVLYPVGLPVSNLRTQLTALTGITTDVTARLTEPGKLQVSLGTIPPGLYLLRILDGDQPIQTLKVIKR